MNVREVHSANLGDHSMGDPPVLIPNTVVKPHRAESTWLDTAREDMLSPDTNASLAQSVEHSAVNRSVVGSSPTRGAKKVDRNVDFFWVLCYNFSAKLSLH